MATHRRATTIFPEQVEREIGNKLSRTSLKSLRFKIHEESLGQSRKKKITKSKTKSQSRIMMIEVYVQQLTEGNFRKRGQKN